MLPCCNVGFAVVGCGVLVNLLVVVVVEAVLGFTVFSVDVGKTDMNSTIVFISLARRACSNRSKVSTLVSRCLIMLHVDKLFPERSKRWTPKLY